MPLSRSIYALACFLLLHVAADSALAQGGQLFPWELEVDVEIETKLTIYDGEGNTLHNATISDTDNWRGDLDTPSNCTAPTVCDWSFEWEAETDTEILFFQFKRSSTNEGLGTYAYVPATERDGRGTFYLPWEGQLVNNWDTYFEVVYENGAYVTKAGRGAGALYEDEFSGLYTIPYDLPYYCAQTTCNANNDRSFLAKVEYIPNPKFPGEPYREFTLASEADARVISNWSPSWDVQDLVLKVPQGRSFVVEGDLDAAGTTFTEADAGQGWNGIDVLGAGTDLDLTNDAVVEHAATGVAVYEGATADVAGSTLRHNGTGLVVHSAAGSSVTASTVHDNGTGIRGDITQSSPGAPVPCLTGCPRSNLTILDSFVEDNTLGGVYAFFSDMDIQETTIRDNGAYGLYASDSRIEPFEQNFVLGNGTGNGSDGAFAALGGDLIFSPQQAGEQGLNRIANNAGAEVFVAGGGNAFLGDATSGENTVFDGVNGTGLLVDNDSKTLIDANNVYWGDPAGPPPGTIDEPVDSTLPLTCDPVTPPDPNDPFPCSTSRTAHRASDAFAGGKGNGDGTLRGGLGARIRAVRAALAADPAGEGAPGLVRLLGGLHRRADTDAEHPATFGLLRSLGARLNNPNVPPAIRATAEAALETVVVDALVGGRNDEATAAIQTGRPRVEDPAVVRVLTLAEAALTAKAGDYATAGALASAVAESEPDEGAQRGGAVLAAHYAELAAESGDGARNGGAHVAAVTERLRGAEAGGAAEADLAVWPNPLSVSGSSAAATVTLALAEAADVRVIVYDVLGRQVAALHSGELTAGSHDLVLDGRALPAGVYLVKAEVGTRRFVERITLVR